MKAVTYEEMGENNWVQVLSKFKILDPSAILKSGCTKILFNLKVRLHDA